MRDARESIDRFMAGIRNPACQRALRGERGWTMREAIDAGRFFHIEGEDGRTITTGMGASSARKAVTIARDCWGAIRPGEVVSVRPHLPGSKIGTALLGFEQKIRSPGKKR